MKKLPRPLRKKPSGGKPSAPAGATVFTLHPDDAAVHRFAFAMKEKLAAKRAEGRAGWQDKELCSGDFLSQLLREHVDKGDPVDVANFAMMLHQRGERIAPAPQDHMVGSELLTTIKEFARWHHLNEMTIAAGKTPSDSEIDFEVIAWNRIKRALAAREGSKTDLENEIAGRAALQDKEAGQ